MKRKYFSITFLFVSLFFSSLDLWADSLIDAVRANNITLIKELLEKGADVHAWNDDALRYAAYYGHYEVVKLLLEKGADVHARNDEALRWASKRGNHELVKLLLEKGADVHAENDDALRNASENGHYEVVKLLLENGANVHAENDNALRWAALNGHYEVVKLLLENGADVHASNRYALRAAARKGHYEVVKLLLENGADVHAENDDALRSAAFYGHHKVVKLLLENGADVHAKNDDALRRAAFYGHHKVVKLLLENGADVHAENDDALRSAAFYGHHKVVKLLLENGADVHAKNDDALRRAAEKGHHEVVKLLVTNLDGSLDEDNIIILVEKNYSQLDDLFSTFKVNSKLLRLIQAITSNDAVAAKAVLKEDNSIDIPEKIIQKALISRNPELIEVLIEHLPSLKNTLIIGLSKYYFSFTDGIIKVVESLNKEQGNAYILALNFKILKNERIMSRVSGLINPGNGDSFPSHYKPFKFNELDRRRLRDSEKLYQEIINYAKSNNIPYFGICSGSQHLALNQNGALSRVDGHAVVWETVSLKKGTFPHFMALSKEEKAKALHACDMEDLELKDAKMAHSYAVWKETPGNDIEIGAYSHKDVVEAISLDGLFNGIQFHSERSYFKSYDWVNRHKYILDSYYSMVVAYHKSKKYAEKNNIALKDFQKAFKLSVKSVQNRLGECVKEPSKKKQTNYFIWNGEESYVVELEDIANLRLMISAGVLPEDIYLSINNYDLELHLKTNNNKLNIVFNNKKDLETLQLAFADGSIHHIGEFELINKQTTSLTADSSPQTTDIMRSLSEDLFY